jgi:hypothetical protein
VVQLRSWWQLLISLKLALVLLILLTLVVAFGSLFPSIPSDIALTPAARQAWLQAAQDRYGVRAALYNALHLFETYRSGWFWVLLAITALTTLACVLSRWRLVWAGPGFDRRRWSRLGALLTHAGAFLLILSAGWSTWGAWRTGGILLPPGQTVPVGHGLPYALRCDGFEVSRYPNGQPRDYRATLSAVAGDQTVLTHDLRVNQPLVLNGVGFYLKSYRPASALESQDAGRQAPTSPTTPPAEAAYYVEVEAIYDPGFWPAVIAAALVVLGILLTSMVSRHRNGVQAWQSEGEP